jgi:endonuclease-3
MDIREKAKEVVSRLKEEYPDVKIALKFENPFQLLVATILSAQCTDERVNMVTPEVFKRFPTPQKLADASLEEIEELIKSTGFYKQKARYLKEAAQIIVEKHGGVVPKTMEELLELPGVARKTANIVLANGYGIVEGIPVDTHVKRLSLRLGLVKSKTPQKIEQELMELLPKEEWFIFPLLLQAHGRRVCLARKPRCEKCVLKDLCNDYLSSH